MPEQSDGPRRPSLGVVRELTDRHVVDQLLDNPELTRAELAARTGISKPTMSESVRRLSEAGVLEEAGQQVGRRGPAGTFYRLRGDIGVAIAVSAGPEGVLAELLDLQGRRLDQVHRAVAVPATQSELEPVLAATVGQVVSSAPGRVLAATLSVAGPVDRATGRLVRLPDSPFLVDALDPVPVLTPLLGLAPIVDNDVDWAAMAERTEGSAQGLDDFVYLYLGPGLGGAVVSAGRVLHGGRGLAGEIAHVRTIGPGGRAVRLVEVFADLGLRRPGSAALDVERIRTVLDAGTVEDATAADVIIAALAGVISSIGTVLDPEAVLVGGPWAGHPALAERLPAAVVAMAAAPTKVRFADLGPDAPHRGACRAAVRAGRAALIDTLQVADRAVPLP
ncbi:MAG TPA: ROK family transcriptional regulator [Microlunatus sp.]